MLLQDALEAATAPTPDGESAEVHEGRGIEQESGALLQEDSTLDDQLNAHEGSSLVETERDRLIRLVCLVSSCPVLHKDLCGLQMAIN